jgi:hypothetical protein
MSLFCVRSAADKTRGTVAIRTPAARNRKRFFTMFSELCGSNTRRCPGDLAKPGY